VPQHQDVRNGTAPWRLPSAAEQAERWIMAVLLVKPDLWNEAQQHVHVEDFSNPEIRRIAELYWEFQRDEGEPEFASLLSVLQGQSESGSGELNDPATSGLPTGNRLGQLAIELLQQGESMPHHQQTLKDAIECLSELRRRTERMKLLAALRRNDQEAENAEDEIQQLRNIAQMAKVGDLRRV
jgi:hypothetical protein